ncbi:MAG: caspase family protein [Acidobacteriota bacterium]
MRQLSFLTFAPLIYLLFQFSIYGQDPPPSRQLEEKEIRIALVIGNAAYKNATTLKNPVNDAEDVSRALKGLGFEVISGTNVTKPQMEDLIRRFGNQLARTKAVGLFFYSGHGIASGGINYLVPVEADIQAEDEVEYGAVNINFLLNKLGVAKNSLNIVVLDACRNNPFVKQWRNYRNIGDQGGLVRIDAPTGTLIAYATKPGNVASDGTGRNGVFTGAFLKHLSSKGIEMSKMFQLVRADVIAQSSGKQVPFDESSIVGDFYFAGVLPTLTAVDPSATNFNNDKEFWDQVKDSSNPEYLKLYKEKFPKGLYISLADLKIANLSPVINPKKKMSTFVPPGSTRYASKSALAQQYLQSGIALVGQGNPKGAIDAFEKSLNAQPEQLEACTRLADAYARWNKYEEAISSLRRCITIYPDDGDLYTVLSWYLGLHHKPIDSIVAAKEAVRLLPMNSGAYSNLCRAYIDLSEPNSAIEACNTALGLNPNDGESYLYLGMAARRNGKTKELAKEYIGKSIDLLVEATKSDRQFDRGFYLLGNAYSSVQRFDEALASFHEALRLNPGLVQAHYNLGIIYALMDNKVAAMNQVDLLAKIEPTLAKLLLNKINNSRRSVQ